MTAEHFVHQLRAVGWDHFQGRISPFMFRQRTDRIWDRIADAGLTADVEKLMERKAEQAEAAPTPAAKGRA